MAQSIPMRPNRLQKHIRSTFLTGIFAAVPVAITIFIVWWINDKTSGITKWIFHGHSVPFVGIMVAIGLIYVTGLVASSLVGRFFLKIVDRLLISVPGFSQLYTAWKQIALTPGGTEGVFSRVV